MPLGGMMQAALLTAFGAPLTVAEVEVPQPHPGEVLIRTRACGICRTDIHMQDGMAYRPSLPHILGHEPAGTIAALGEGVTGWQVGDRVVSYLFEGCGHCAACAEGSASQCDHVEGILGITRNGGFAEYFTARGENLIRVPDAVPLETAGLVSCAAVTAVHAIGRAALQAGHRVAVIGAGGIGLLIVQALVAEGYEVDAIGRSEQSRRESLAEGAAAALTPHEAEQGGSERYHRIFDLVGTAATTRLAGEIVHRRGRIVMIGEEPEFPAIDTIRLAQKEIDLVGSRNGAKADAEAALRLMQAGVLKPKIAGVVPLSQINSAFDLLRAGGVLGRILVEPGR